MISVAEAQDQIAALISPLDTEIVALRDAGGRVLALDAIATRNQPPFAASAMDGYAVRSQDLRAGAELAVVGEVAAGARFTKTIGRGEAVRIFTGAPIPPGADHVLIQEDAERRGDAITIKADHETSGYVRPAGTDFAKGFTLPAPRRLSSADVALLASMGHPRVTVFRRPKVALIATGDELVWPGDAPTDSQIIASNSFGLKTDLERHGAVTHLLPIGRDNRDSLRSTFALAADFDLIVTMGGASVGDHDLVSDIATQSGLDLSFHKVAMRPGKPLMAGRIGNSVLIGLPGNPVSSMVCSAIFVVPAIAAFQGLGYDTPAQQTATLGIDIGPNGPREHYMRARVEFTGERPTCTPFTRQDSSLLSVLSDANALMVRAPDEPALTKGTPVPFILL